MAWQLIYTSAPRLLEAGRTGFGTVARHRAVSGMLVSIVERFSQFARLPGYDPRRVVHTYRILTVGSGSYHVFSCLQDAGSDYTGRTNHLAQHVIAEAREIRALTASGLTPADILLAIPWRSTWTEVPRFLDPAEEIDLAGLRPATTSAWTTATGNPAYARLLCTPQALKGCYLIPPPGVSVLELFREAMMEAPQAGWQTSFTTTLEPNDEVGDFRWIGLPPGSPLRSQAETSNRPLLDLTQPAKLLAPPEPPAKLVPATPEPDAAPASLEVPVPVRSPDKVSLAHPMRSQSSPIPATTIGSWSPESRNKSPKKSRKPLAMALVLVAVITASTTGLYLWQHITEKKERTAFQGEIKEVWESHGLALKKTREVLGDELEVENGRAMLRSLDAYLKVVRVVLKNPESKKGPPLPENTGRWPDFEELQDAFDKWMQVNEQGPMNVATTATNLRLAYDEWLAKRQSCWKTLSNYLKKIGSIPQVDSAVLAQFADTARAALHDKQPDEADVLEWELLNERLKDKMINAWLKVWKELGGGGKQRVAENAQKDDSLPPWLKTSSKKVLESIRAISVLADKAKKQRDMEAEAASIAASVKQKTEDADSLDAKHPIYVFLSVDDARTKIQQIKAGMRVYVGAVGDKNTLTEERPEPQTGELIAWVEHLESSKTRWIYGESKAQQNKSDLLEFDEAGTITRLPARAKDGLRIVARSKNGTEVLFDLRVLPATSSLTAPLLAFVPSIQIVNSDPEELRNLGKLTKRLFFNGFKEVKYKILSLKEGVQKPLEITRQNNDDYKLTSSDQPANPPTKNNTKLTKQIEDLQQGIKALEKLKNQTNKKDSEYTNKMAGYDSDIAKKNDEITRLKSQNANVEQPQVQPAFHFEEGKYTLQAHLGDEKVWGICIIQLVSEKMKTGQSK